MQKGNTNTIILVIILMIIVGLGVWWFAGNRGATEEKNGIDVNVSLPSGNDNGGGTSGGGSYQ